MNNKNKKVKTWEKIKPVVLEWGESIFIAFILAMFIRTFFFQAFRIPSGSMRTTLMEGDRLIVNKLQYGPKVPLSGKISFFPGRFPGFTEPKRGDVLVFVYPDNPKKDFIKRLIATGGETVEIKHGDIYINGQLVEDPVIKSTYYYNRGLYGQARKRIKIPEGYYYVLGDNSASSHDSRFWGFIPKAAIIGKAELIYWPPARIRLIQ